jgi:hypothetical protein
MLKIASTTFHEMPATDTANQNSATPDDDPVISMIFATSPQTSACTMLEPGPAPATQNMSRFGWRRLLKLTGTGFAQPKKMPPRTSEMSGKTMVPMGSMCLAGFSVTRPIM